MISEAASHELRRLLDAHGGTLRPHDVVDAARPDTSPLHPYFDWDDTAAAAKWRLWQARSVIRVAVQIEPTKPDSARAVRVFVSLPADRTPDGPGYRLLTQVLSDHDLRAQLLLDARDEMKRFREKYRQLAELAEVFAAMDRVEQRTTDDEPAAVAR